MEFPWKVRVTRRRERNKGGELQETRDTFVVLTNSSDSPLLPHKERLYLADPVKSGMIM